jgi:hypothetical protein
MFPQHRDTENSLEPSINSLAVICKTFNLFEGAGFDEEYRNPERMEKKKSVKGTGIPSES